MFPDRVAAWVAANDLATDGFWYVGTPYSKYPGGIDLAFKVTCRITAEFIRRGVPVFSPIAHSHPVAVHGGIDPLDHKIWLPADAPMVRAAHGLIVVQMDTWAESVGLRHEIEAVKAAGKPVLFYPGVEHTGWAG